MNTYRHGKKLITVNDKGRATKVVVYPSINMAKVANRHTKHEVHRGHSIAQTPDCVVIEIKR